MPSSISCRNFISKRFKEIIVPSSLQIEMVENQANVIRRSLDKFTLEKLGGIACLNDGMNFCHGLFQDDPLIAENSKWSLQTQGIFAGTPFARNTVYKPGKEPIYPSAHAVAKTFGLARSGEWLLIEIDYARHIGRRDYEQAVCVRISESNLTKIVEQTGIRLSNIFHCLVLAVRDWVHARKVLYDDALNLEKNLETEFELFNMINL